MEIHKQRLQWWDFGKDERLNKGVGLNGAAQQSCISVRHLLHAVGLVLVSECSLVSDFGRFSIWRREYKGCE